MTQETLTVCIFIFRDKRVGLWGAIAGFVIIAGVFMGAVIWGIGVWRGCQFHTSLIMTLCILSKKVGIQVVVGVLSLLSLCVLWSFLTILGLECCTFSIKTCLQIRLKCIMVVFSILNVDPFNLLSWRIVDAYLNASLLCARTNVKIILEMQKLDFRIVLILWRLRFYRIAGFLIYVSGRMHWM